MNNSIKKEAAHSCCMRILNSGGWGRTHACGNKAKVERDGKRYCGTHDPVVVKEKTDIRNAKRNKEFAESVAANRVRQAAPELLAALQTLVAEHGGTIGAGSDHPYAIAARAAIQKATGESA